MTNKQFSMKLRLVADVYEHAEIEDLSQASLSMYVTSKKAVIDLVKSIGGKFTKSMDEYNYRLNSERLGITIVAPRDKFCKKIVTYECEPLFSKEDDAEIISNFADEL